MISDMRQLSSIDWRRVAFDDVRTFVLGERCGHLNGIGHVRTKVLGVRTKVLVHWVISTEYRRLNMRRVRYKEAAKYTGIPEATLRSMVCLKTIPHIRIGPRMVLLDLDQLDAWITERTVMPAAVKR